MTDPCNYDDAALCLGVLILAVSRRVVLIPFQTFFQKEFIFFTFKHKEGKQTAGLFVAMK